MFSYLHTSPIEYDGSQLRSLFAYEISGTPGDCILAFCGPMNVKNHMVDMEDVLAKDFIRSTNALNFIVELFDRSIETTVLYQLLLVSIIRKTLIDVLKIPEASLKQDGDDLMYYRYTDKEWYKLSVSIATKSVLSGLIHTAINVDSTSDMPIRIISLKEIYEDLKNRVELQDSLDLNIINYIAKQILLEFVSKVESIKRACVKVRSV